MRRLRVVTLFGAVMSLLGGLPPDCGPSTLRSPPPPDVPLYSATDAERLSAAEAKRERKRAARLRA